MDSSFWPLIISRSMAFRSLMSRLMFANATISFVSGFLIANACISTGTDAPVLKWRILASLSTSRFHAVP